MNLEIVKNQLKEGYLYQNININGLLWRYIGLVSYLKVIKNNSSTYICKAVSDRPAFISNELLYFATNLQSKVVLSAIDSDYVDPYSLLESFKSGCWDKRGGIITESLNKGKLVIPNNLRIINSNSSGELIVKPVYPFYIKTQSKLTFKR